MPQISRKWLGLPDPDSVLAYDTVKEVRVLDRRLGIVYSLVQFVVVFYIVVVVFVIKKQYLDNEKTSGWTICKVRQPQLSQLGVPWDVYDRITNPGEQSAVFIPTRILVTKGQSQESACESPIHNCTTKKDCDVGHAEGMSEGCSANGKCIRHEWCPAEDPSSATTETHYLFLDEVEIWFQTFVHYIEFDLDVSTTDEKEVIRYPDKRANTYKLKDLLRMASLEPGDFAENGAIILTNVLFRCDLDSRKCEMKVEAHNIDTFTGFNHVHNHVYWENGVRKRDSYRMYGIRLVTSTTGFGTKISFSQIMLQISSAISLLSIAETVADFWLTYIVPERNHYVQQKIEQTEDFNE